MSVRNLSDTSDEDSDNNVNSSSGSNVEKGFSGLGSGGSFFSERRRSSDFMTHQNSMKSRPSFDSEASSSNDGFTGNLKHEARGDYEMNFNSDRLSNSEHGSSSNDEDSSPSKKGFDFSRGDGTGMMNRRSFNQSGDSQSRKRNRESLEGESSSNDNDLCSPPKKVIYSAKPYASSGMALDVPLPETNIGRAMMEKMMGYKPGQGLGKHAQGRVEPVELSTQRGRRGLGLTLPNLDPATLQWDPSSEDVSKRETIEMLNGSFLRPLDYETLETWTIEGEKDLDIENMTDFCDPDVLKNILKSKSVFDSLTDEELRRARLRSNPFETLKNAIFLNRAALKMANMDAAFDFMFTEPKYKNGAPMVDTNNLLYFADVCAGPGGFSEYVLWRKKWRAKGFGFTLKGNNDFKLEDFFAGPPETFQTHYGEANDGNIFNPKNITSLTNLVMKETSKGVHFMMADGGFSVEGQENIQELLSKQLYLCQFLVALCILRPEGHFVCKLFDLFSPFSVGLVYLMYRAFSEISIFKPNTSRPANSERYIICKWMRADSEPIKKYMFSMCERLWEFGPDSDMDITHCVPMEVLMEDNYFYDYILKSNNVLGQRQIVHLCKIAAFYRDNQLVDDRQQEFKRDCLSLWKVPDKPRMADRTSPESAAKNILGPARDQEFLSSPGTNLKDQNLEEAFGLSLYDWICFPLGSKKVGWFLSLGGVKTYKWTGKDWKRFTDGIITLSPGTLVFAEIVVERIGEGSKQKKLTSFHIIDAVSIGYEYISHHSYFERHKLLKLYEHSLAKSSVKNPVRIKDHYQLENVDKIFAELTLRFMKSSGCGSQLVLEKDDIMYDPKGILFFKMTAAPWAKHRSKKTGAFYYYNSISKESLFDKEMPKGYLTSAMACAKTHVIWIWEEGAGIKKEGPKDGVLHMNALLNFVKEKCPRQQCS